MVFGDQDMTELKSFWYKVKCKVDGEMFQLCSARKNLKANLLNPLHGLKHSKALQDLAPAERTSSNAIYTGRKGRPFSSSRSTVGNQNNLHAWFKAFDKNYVGKCPSSEAGKCYSPLSLLCWGLRSQSTTYGGFEYAIFPLLHDPKPGRMWVPKPAT